MRNYHDEIDEIRRLDPIDGTRLTDSWSDSEAKKTLFQELRAAQASRAATPDPARRRPVSRRRAIGGLITAAVLVSAGTVAAAVTMSRPDPKQSAQVEDDFSSDAKIHLEGWRPELSAEDVVCLFPETEKGLDTSASEFPLKQRLTSEELARECTEGNDWASKLAQDGVGPFSVDTATLCISEEGAYPKAVVGVGGIDCSTTPVEDFLLDEQGDVVVDENGNPVLKYIQARAMTPDDLKELNSMRAIEVAVLAVPSEDGCPTSEQATEWAEARLKEFGVSGLDIRSSGGGDGCYRGRISWNTGFSSDTGEVWIDVAGNQA